MPIDLTVFKMSSPKYSTDKFSILTKKMHYSFIKQVKTSNLNALRQSTSNSEWRRLPSSSLLQSH